MAKDQKIYYGVFLYEDEPAVLLANADSWDDDFGDQCHPLSEEVYAMMASLGLEHIEETLWGYYDGSEEDLIKDMKKVGFIFKQEVKMEGESILG